MELERIIYHNTKRIIHSNKVTSHFQGYYTIKNLKKNKKNSIHLEIFIV